MPAAPAHPLYLFRPVTAADLPLLARWRAMPHVAQWWGRPEAEAAEDALADPHVAMWIVAFVPPDGAPPRPFAYAQDYSPHDWDPHPFSHLPPGSRGIDQYIGEPDMVGLGHGSAFVRLHCERLFAAGAPAIGTDPHPDNKRAIRAYEKAGFSIASAPLDTRWGRAILMERWKDRAAADERCVSLFSYGTLRQPEVQRANYGRLLEGAPDTLRGYRLAALEISDPEVVRISGKAVHTIARRTGDPKDEVEGMVFRLGEEELAATDRYEVDVYARVEAELASGTRAWVYVGPPLSSTGRSGSSA
jgi:aminoglycoside 6'-N-acetyltransferase